ncbi:hypothetical protein PMAYCL1PPCAC_05019, partial [Pristionchus mayeri]
EITKTRKYGETKDLIHSMMTLILHQMLSQFFKPIKPIFAGATHVGLRLLFLADVTGSIPVSSKCPITVLTRERSIIHNSTDTKSFQLSR